MGRRPGLPYWPENSDLLDLVLEHDVEQLSSSPPPSGGEAAGSNPATLPRSGSKEDTHVRQACHEGNLSRVSCSHAIIPSLRTRSQPRSRP